MEMDKSRHPLILKDMEHCIAQAPKDPERSREAMAFLLDAMAGEAIVVPVEQCPSVASKVLQCIKCWEVSGFPMAEIHEKRDACLGELDSRRDQ